MAVCTAFDVGSLPLENDIICKYPTPAGLTSLKIVHVNRHGLHVPALRRGRCKVCFQLLGNGWKWNNFKVLNYM